MDIISEVICLIKKIWEEPLSSDILTTKLDVSVYNKLSELIPDQYIALEEVFPRSELENIWDNYEAYLDEYEIFPFIGTLGEAVICVGFGDSNKGNIFYFDFDFGCVQLNDDHIDDFVSKLKHS